MVPRGRLWAAVLALAFTPALTGILISGALAREPDTRVAAERDRLTSAAAADLLLREGAIEARLTALAADPEIARLAGELASSTSRQLSSEALSRLRAADGSIIAGGCLTKPADARVTGLGVSPTDVGPGSTCLAGEDLPRFAGSAVGQVKRTHVTTSEGTRRLLITTPIHGVGTDAALLTGEIDVAALLAATPSASNEASTVLIFDELGSEVVAGSSRSGEHEAAARTPLQPREVAVYVRGILMNHRPAVEDLAAAGWVTTVASLWSTDDGSDLSLIQVWPKPPPPLAVDLILALVGLAAAALTASTAFMRQLMRPFQELEESQTQLAAMYREAREDSLHDGLTGMGNHRSFRDELARQIDLFERHRIPFVLILIDLDNLKVVNDREGHAQGDRLLVGLSRAMREAFRVTDRLFRIGGDEFAVLLPDTEPEDAMGCAGRLHHYCARPPSGERPIRFSGGLSAVPTFAHEANQLYKQADAALYWAKRQRRGFVEVFDPQRDEVPGEAGPAGLDNVIHDVIRSHAFSPVFQPIVDLRTGIVLGFEGLVRPDPRGPFPDAHRLFSAAAATGRTVELDLASLEVVAEGARGIGGDHMVSVNLSAKTLEVAEFDAAWLLNTLVRHGISPSRVIVELTERDPITDMKTLQRNVRHLAEYGLRLAADDVGAGNAGLRLLSQVSFDIVKIDLSLVQEAARNTVTWAVLRSLRDFALRQDAIVIGEGVETPEQLRALRQLDIPIGQGYLLGRPQSRPDVSAVDLVNLSALGLGPEARGATQGPGSSSPVIAPGRRGHPPNLRQIQPHAVPVGQ